MLSFKKVKKEIRLILHKGDKIICPFCGYRAKDLRRMGLNYPVLYEKQIVGAGRRRAKCYNCRSTDRERLVSVYLKDVLKILEGDRRKKILHIAPEENLSKQLLNYGFDEYICGDLFTEGYNYPDHVQNIDVLDIPFDDNSFDLIICNHVLEHVQEDVRAMKELLRVLKIGGKAILQVPISKNSAITYEDFTITDPEQRKLFFGQYNHVRIYGQDYTERLKSSGFNVNVINISNDFQEYGLNKDEDIYIGEK